jgi:hypothetical protein
VDVEAGVQIGYRLDVNEGGKSGSVHGKKPNKINVLMAENDVRDAGVAGSNPATPTNKIKYLDLNSDIDTCVPLRVHGSVLRSIKSWVERNWSSSPNFDVRQFSRLFV